MVDLPSFLAGVGLTLALTAGLLGQLWWRLRVMERAAEAALREKELADAEKRITAAVVEKAFGMMRNVAETRAAEPEVLHPIKERQLAEAALWDLAAQRDLHNDITERLNGKGR